MSMISRGLLARPEETSMVVAVAFSEKRSLFTAVMMHSPVAYAIGVRTPKMSREKTKLDRDMGMVPGSGG
jgi:hypothetical protein